MLKSFPRRSSAASVVASPRADAVPLRDLVLEFESLGSNCEFGAFQRFCGAEPLSLFRFVGSRTENLVRVLDRGFDGFLTEDDLKLVEVGSEQMLVSRRYDDFLFHTTTAVSDEIGSGVFARQARINAYLKTRFLDDWADAARIYVHSGDEDESAMTHLHTVLRRRSACTLLWVVRATGSAAPGSVERLGNGFLKGHLEYLSRFDRGPQLDIASWIAICHRAKAHVHGGTIRMQHPGRRVATAFRWHPTSDAICQTTATGGRCYLRSETRYLQSVIAARVAVPLAAKTLVTVSLWIYFSDAFEATMVDVIVEGAAVICQRRAVPSLRNAWQQIWAVAKPMQSCDALEVSIRIDKAKSRSSFFFAGWQIQDGILADASLKPGRDPIVENAGPVPSRGATILRGIAERLRSAAAAIEKKSAPQDTHDRLNGDVLAHDFLRMGDAAMRASLFEAADAILRVGVHLYPWDAALLSHFALSATWAGRFAEAVERWAALATMFPRLAHAHYSLAASHRSAGDIDRAIAIIEAVMDRFPDDACMLAEAARIYGAAGRSREALIQWDRALALVGDHAEWRRSRSEVLAAEAKHVAPHRLRRDRSPTVAVTVGD